MIVEIRMYRLFDTDLVSLFDSGYPVALMMKSAIQGYANGTPVHYLVDVPTTIAKSDSRSIHTRLFIPDSDSKSIMLMKGVRKGYRNSFCKMMMRNALINQNLSFYYSGQQLTDMAQAYLDTIPPDSFPSVIRLSKMKKEVRQLDLTEYASVLPDKVKPGEKILRERKPYARQTSAAYASTKRTGEKTVSVPAVNNVQSPEGTGQQAAPPAPQIDPAQLQALLTQLTQSAAAAASVVQQSPALTDTAARDNDMIDPALVTSSDGIKPADNPTLMNIFDKL